MSNLNNFEENKNIIVVFHLNVLNLDVYYFPNIKKVNENGVFEVIVEVSAINLVYFIGVQVETMKVKIFVVLTININIHPKDLKKDNIVVLERQVIDSDTKSFRVILVIEVNYPKNKARCIIDPYN